MRGWWEYQTDIYKTATARSELSDHLKADNSKHYVSSSLLSSRKWSWKYMQKSNISTSNTGLTCYWGRGRELIPRELKCNMKLLNSTLHFSHNIQKCIFLILFMFHNCNPSAHTGGQKCLQPNENPTAAKYLPYYSTSNDFRLSQLSSRWCFLSLVLILWFFWIPICSYEEE